MTMRTNAGRGGSFLAIRYLALSDFLEGGDDTDKLHQW
jgi:hypothetical protein